MQYRLSRKMLTIKSNFKTFTFGNDKAAFKLLKIPILQISTHVSGLMCTGFLTTHNIRMYSRKITNRSAPENHMTNSLFEEQNDNIGVNFS